MDHITYVYELCQIKLPNRDTIPWHALHLTFTLQQDTIQSAYNWMSNSNQWKCQWDCFANDDILSLPGNVGVEHPVLYHKTFLDWSRSWMWHYWKTVLKAMMNKPLVFLFITPQNKYAGIWLVNHHIDNFFYFDKHTITSYNSIVIPQLSHGPTFTNIRDRSI